MAQVASEFPAPPTDLATRGSETGKCIPDKGGKMDERAKLTGEQKEVAIKYKELFGPSIPGVCEPGKRAIAPEVWAAGYPTDKRDAVRRGAEKRTTDRPRDADSRGRERRHIRRYRDTQRTQRSRARRERSDVHRRKCSSRPRTRRSRPRPSRGRRSGRRYLPRN